MKKLYTLQECFEMNESKFPFTVEYYDPGHSKHILNEYVKKRIILTITSKHNKLDKWTHYPDYRGTDFRGPLANTRSFDYKIAQ